MASAHNVTSILAKLEGLNWVADTQQVETLAYERYANANAVGHADGVYLKVLLVAIQARLGRKTRGRVSLETQGQVLEETHAKFYDAVLRGVTTIDIAIDETLTTAERSARALERNRRSAFARSSKSTLATFSAAGGDLRSLDVATVTKSSLRAAHAPPEPTDKVERQIARTRAVLLRAFTRRAKVDQDKAVAAIEATIEDLQALVEGMTASKPSVQIERRRAPQDRGHARTRVGAVVLNSGAAP